MKLFRTQAIFLALATLCSASLGGEKDKAAPAKVLPVLKPDAALLARIAALPENTWLKLPPFKATGDLGALEPGYKRTGPRVRDYCNKMVWAPDRKRALYCGGGHGNHPYNDVWEYDLAANTWVCLYGPDPAPPRTKAGEEDKAVAWYKKHARLKGGSVRTPRGAPLRPCHTWWSLAYDSDRRLMLFLESHKGLFRVDKAALAKALNIDPKDPLFKTYGSGRGESWLFTFDPNKRKWKDVLTKVPKAYESACLEYLPESKTAWWLSGKTYSLDAAKRKWVAYPAAKAAQPGGGGETAYDPETRKIVATVGRETWVFSCKDNRWTLVQKNAPDGGFVPLSTFCYDTVAKRFVLYTHLKLTAGPAKPRLRLYDLKGNKWTDPKPQGELPKKTGNYAGYYDPERNVTVIYGDRGSWVYRCKRATKQEVK